MNDLPKHEAKWETQREVDKDGAVFGDEDTSVFVVCPSCKNWLKNQITWGDMDRGTIHGCNACGYKWIMT